MKLDKDFMDWLKADEGINQGTGLLLAPLNFAPPDTAQEITAQLQNLQDTVESLESVLQIPVPEESEQILIPYTEETETSHDEPEKESLPPEFHDPDIDINQAWKERAAGNDLSLDEPPHEIWTRINESASEYDDDEEIEYEQGVSLQGAAYVQKREHGKNFTQRLQYTLKGRKQKAQREREEEENRKPKHPYIRMAVNKCLALLITIGLSWLALLFIQRWTPENMSKRALKFYEQGKFDEAMNLYQQGYKLYPDMLGFLTGISESAEKLGHVQTAETAREEFNRLSPSQEQPPEEPPQVSEPVLSDDIESQDVQQEIEIKLPKKPPVIPVTSDEFLREAVNAFNQGMYNVAIIYFFRASELNPVDVRPYIGLAESYRAKKMYFDSMRILDEANKRFKRNPTLDVIRKFLKEASK